MSGRVSGVTGKVSGVDQLLPRLLHLPAAGCQVPVIGVNLYTFGVALSRPMISNFNIRYMALHGKNGSRTHKIYHHGPPIIFRN